MEEEEICLLTMIVNIMMPWPISWAAILIMPLTKRGYSNMISREAFMRTASTYKDSLIRKAQFQEMV